MVKSIILGVIIAPMISGVCLAEERVPCHCLVGVRVIRGTGPDKAMCNQPVKTGEFLSDVKSQLESLPYSNFRVMDKAEKKVPLGEFSNFPLSDGDGKHLLKVKPLWSSGDRVDLQLEWETESGESLLSTRVGVHKGMSVVVGAESSESLGTILGLKVDCEALGSSAPSLTRKESDQGDVDSKGPIAN